MVDDNYLQLDLTALVSWFDQNWQLLCDVLHSTYEPSELLMLNYLRIVIIKLLLLFCF